LPAPSTSKVTPIMKLWTVPWTVFYVSSVLSAPNIDSLGHTAAQAFPSRHGSLAKRLDTSLVSNTGSSRVTEVSRNWAGVVLHPPENEAFDAMTGQFTLPLVSTLDTPGRVNGSYVVSLWIGIGGSPKGVIFQSGIDARITRLGDQVSVEYVPWLEWFPLETGYISDELFSASAGDVIEVVITTSGTSQGFLTLLNLSTRKTYYVDLNEPVTSPNGPLLITGNSVEWIVENLESRLAVFETLTFTKCVASTAQDTLTLDSAHNMAMVPHRDGRVVAQANFVNQTSFQVTYDGSRA